MPEFNAAIRAKANTSVMARNTVELWTMVIGWAGKF
jgi:hypothetical protein